MELSLSYLIESLYIRAFGVFHCSRKDVHTFEACQGIGGSVKFLLIFSNQPFIAE